MLHWTVHVKGGPSRRYNAAVAVGREVYSFGGPYDADAGTDDVHVFNTATLRWAKLAAAAGTGERTPLNNNNNNNKAFFSTRWGRTAVMIEDVVYLWGGRTDTLEYCGAVDAFDVAARRWSRPAVSGAVPDARSYHSACVRAKVMYVYGGFARLSGRTNDIHKLDTDAMLWSSVNAARGGAPAVISCEHSATVIGTTMFAFGGYSHNFDYDDNNVRAFDTETDLWLSVPSARLRPEGRCCHSAFARNGELYIFGGHNMTRPFNDMWKFNSATFTWTNVEPKGNKGPLWTSRMCCCVVGDCASLFGGYESDDLYILDLSPSLKTLCKLAVIQHGMEQEGLPHNIRWELAAMTTATEEKNNVSGEENGECAHW